MFASKKIPMRKKILIPFLLLATVVFSQDTKKFPKPDPDFRKYLNDGTLELAKNAFKVHFDGLINHEIVGSYERKFTDGISLEVGGGLFSKYPAYFENEFVYETEVTDSISDPKKSGYTFQVMPKFYLSKQGIDNGSYIGILFKQRYLENWYKETIRYTEFSMMMGFQKLVSKKVCLDLGYGFGFANSVILSDKYEDYNYGFFPVMHIRVGVGFFLGKNENNSSKPSSKKIKKKENNDEDDEE